MRKLFLPLLLSCLISPAFAQENAAVPSSFNKEKYCRIVPEEIVPLKVPNFDGAVEWQRATGIQGMDRPRDMLLIADGGMVVLGESALFLRKMEAGAAGKTEGKQPLELVFLRLDKGGKIILEKRQSVDGLKFVVAGIVTKDRVVAMSQVDSPKTGAAIRLDFLDGKGESRESRIVGDKKYNLIPVDITLDMDSGQMVLAAQAVNRKNSDDRFTLLIRTDATGKEVSRKEYLPGIPTRLEELEHVPGGGFIGNGRIEVSGDSSGNRAGGWLLKLTRQGDIVTQRPYPRGAGSTIRKIVSARDGTLIAVGDAVPGGGGERAAWVMKLSSSGEPIWQKYITGHYIYSAIDAGILTDGRVTVLMAGYPSGEGGREHMRLVAFTPTGQMTGDEAYIEGGGVVPVKMLLRGDRRAVAAMAQTGFAGQDAPEDERLATYDFWVVGLTSLAPYNDPCSAAPVVDKNLDAPL
jgi:hypothetical protein